MAIDTENKRRSVLAYSFSPVLPLASGTAVDIDDRRAVVGLYSFDPTPGGTGGTPGSGIGPTGFMANVGSFMVR